MKFKFNNRVLVFFPQTQFALGAGFTVKKLPRYKDSIASENDYAAILNADWIKDEQTIARLSTNFTHNTLSADIALSYSIDPVDIDAEGFQQLQARIAGGLVYHRKDGIFGAVEFARVENTYKEVHVQIGLESTLELPGFQRKTLTQE